MKDAKEMANVENGGRENGDLTCARWNTMIGMNEASFLTRSEASEKNIENVTDMRIVQL